MKKVIVLRPEPAASATVERAKQQGLEALALPLFEVAPIAWALPDPATYDAILITSANAIRHGGEQIGRLAKVPVHAVGQATASAAKEAGLNVATVGEGGIAELLRSIPGDVRLLHVRGREHMPMQFAVHQIEPVTVYAAQPRETVTGLDVLNDSVVLLHSPRAGARLAELVDDAGMDRSRMAIVAISLNAALAAGTGWARVKVADVPGDAALLALAARLCNKSAGE